jgi:hypothetical protein
VLASPPLMEWITVFVHIPKTAGTSVRLLFESNHKRQQLLRVYPIPNNRPWSVTREELVAMPAEELADVEVVFGHLPFGIHRRLPRPCRYVTVIRHPVDRVVSHYYHHVRRVAQGRPADVPIDKAVAAGLSLAAFARGEIPNFNAKSPRAAPPSRNLMTRLLSSSFPTGAGGPDDPVLLEQAKRNLAEHFLLIGVTEHLPGFVKLLGRELGWSDSGNLQRANTNPNRPTVESLDPETVEVIRQHNQLDLALYEHVVEITKEGTKLAPGVGGRRRFGSR